MAAGEVDAGQEASHSGTRTSDGDVVPSELDVVANATPPAQTFATFGKLSMLR
ncbi:hypothetical protein [Kineosporia sp. A_224]|uniref:hypothetical protein n=1 Tax=Kineosporia sp. A_224 TaxID=1962180 RepID=UPI0013045579|nr:hypothetical protein [Kineosporia sp. A_224]